MDETSTKNSKCGNSDTEWKMLWLQALDLQDASAYPGETPETKKEKRDQVLQRGFGNESSQTYVLKSGK